MAKFIELFLNWYMKKLIKLIELCGIKECIYIHVFYMVL